MADETELAMKATATAQTATVRGLAGGSAVR